MANSSKAQAFMSERNNRDLIKLLQMHEKKNLKQSAATHYSVKQVDKNEVIFGLVYLDFFI